MYMDKRCRCVGLIVVALFVFSFQVVAQANGGLRDEQKKKKASFRLDILYGEDINVSGASQEEIEDGYSYFLDKTTIKVQTSPKKKKKKKKLHWEVRAKVCIINWPPGADNPGLQAIEIRNNDSNQWIPGGGVVQTGKSHPKAVVFTVDYRLNLASLGNGGSGSYAFEIIYSVQEK